jgi:aryl-alcohol dehydrogenase-like predicted oxidoreductase
MLKLSRRGFIERGLKAAGAALLLDPRPVESAWAQQQMIRRPIPKSSELVPIIGLGSVGTFNVRPNDRGYADAQEVVRLFAQLGGKVIDTAPGYQDSERFVGETIQRLGVRDEVFLATKFNATQVAAGARIRRGGTLAEDRAEMDSQMEESLRLAGRRRLDLQQVWNLGDTQSNAERSSTPAGYLQRHLEKAIEWKAGGLTRYIGITTSRDPQYREVEDAMSRYPIDFVQLDFSIEDPLPEQRLLPAALDNGVAVLINRPFGSGSLFRLASQRRKTIPPWAAELGIASWAQYFLKYIVSHPAVTAAIPATSDPRNLRDNMGAGMGELPDAATRGRMREYWRE